MTSPGQAPGVTRRGAAWSAAWVFVALAVLLAPVYAHGCHGDDVDHEPVLFPLKWLEDE